jgi:hypothetical protein
VVCNKIGMTDIFNPILRGGVGVNRKDVKGLYAYCCNKMREVWEPEATHPKFPQILNRFPDFQLLGSNVLI